MLLLRFYLIVVIGAALAATGIRPSEHLHHSTPAHPQIVHSHFEYAPGTGPHLDGVGVNDVDSDDHEHAIDLEQVIAAGPRAPSAGQALLGVAGALAPHLRLVFGDLRFENPEPTASPPSHLTSPRAPPA
ncbi:MAG: hypothetical protein EHM24_09435 [Acidobacteria bacterium]|nr:MAG: hypothetical protein EHM24_09435 [Acidobacteriota bacterium]